MAEARPLPTEAPGVYLFPDAFERIVAGLRRGIDALAADEPMRVLGVPPVIARGTIERTGYPASFPHLLGTVHSFTGDAKQWSALSPLVEAGGAWQSTHEPTDLVLLPAACYPVYASMAGQTLDRPRTHRVSARCFRQEATAEIGRLRSFRMVEFVTAGDPQAYMGDDEAMAGIRGAMPAFNEPGDQVAQDRSGEQNRPRRHRGGLFGWLFGDDDSEQDAPPPPRQPPPPPYQQ